MAPSIEKIWPVLKSEGVLAEERRVLYIEKMKILSHLEKGVQETMRMLPEGLSSNRSVLAVSEALNEYGKWSPNFGEDQYIKMVKYIEKRPLIGKEVKAFFFGIAFKYSDLKEIMPETCRRYSGKECMEINEECWNIIKDPNKWNPKDGEFQVFETEDGIDDEIIVTEEIPKDTELWKALKDVNDKTGLFN